MTTETTTVAAANPTRTRRAKAPVGAAPKQAAAAASPPASAGSPSAPATKPTSKSDTVIKLLLRARGATPMELIAATDWQPHSLRAFLSGLRKKGRNIVREERKGGGFAYRIVASATGSTPDGDAGEGKPLEDAGDGTDGTPNTPSVASNGRTAVGAGEA